MNNHGCPNVGAPFTHAPPPIITDTLPTKYYWGRDAHRLEGNKDKPPVPISVERPIFHVLKAAGKLPEPGHAAAVRISPELVLVVREG